jgi:TetR/AcrR family transcriptional regulator
MDARSRILSAAAEVFATIGFAAARVDEIAARAGVNKAMLYYHVGDKEHLYSTILTETVERALHDFRAAAQGSRTPSEKLTAILDTLAGFGTSNPQFVPIFLREVASGGATLPDDMLMRMADVFRIVSDVLAEGTRKGAFRKTDPLLTHVSLVGSMMFLIASQPIRARLAKVAGIAHKHTLHDLASHTSNLILHGLEAGNAAPKTLKRSTSKSRSRK